MVNYRIPKGFEKGNLQQIQFLQRKQAAAYGIGLDLPAFFLLLQGIVPGLQSFVSFCQRIILLYICRLGLFPGSIATIAYEIIVEQSCASVLGIIARPAIIITGSNGGV